jgi:DNA-binding MarR family transcriptional regulator
MSCDWQKDLQIPRTSVVACLPPALVQETGWDILLALHSDAHCDLSLEKLCALISVSQEVMVRWLASLEERHLITGATDGLTGQLRAVLSKAGRELLDRYLSVTRSLQLNAHH